MGDKHRCSLGPVQNAEEKKLFGGRGSCPTLVLKQLVPAAAWIKSLKAWPGPDGQGPRERPSMDCAQVPLNVTTTKETTKQTTTKLLFCAQYTLSSRAVAAREDILAQMQAFGVAFRGPRIHAVGDSHPFRAVQPQSQLQIPTLSCVAVLLYSIFHASILIRDGAAVFLLCPTAR